MSILGNNLRSLRKAKGLQQADMQQAIGIGRSTWANYESSLTEPSIGTLITIAQYFSVTLDDLVTKDLSPALTTADDNKQRIKHPKNAAKNKNNNAAKAQASPYQQDADSSELHDARNLDTWVVMGLLQKMDSKLDGIRNLVASRAAKKSPKQ